MTDTEREIQDICATACDSAGQGEAAPEGALAGSEVACAHDGQPSRGEDPTCTSLAPAVVKPVERQGHAKRRLAVVALTACLLALIAVGSSAYFQDVDFEVNRYTVAGQASSGDFSIAINEESSDDTGVSDGTGGLLYEGIVPGNSYSKEVSVENTSAEDRDAWVRVHVQITKAREWEALLGGAPVSSLFDRSVTPGWERELRDPNNPALGVVEPALEADGSLTYTYYWHEPLAKGAETPCLFTSVTIPASVDAAGMNAINGFQIVVWAEALEDAADLPDGLDSCQKVFGLW